MLNMQDDLNPGGLSSRAPSQWLTFRTFFYRVLLGIIILAAGGCATHNKPAPVTSDVQLGIEIVGVRYLAAGYMLDFRYRVKDPEKSLPMFDRSTIPYLLHEKSGAKFMVPSPAKLGPFRATTKKAEIGKRYYMVFANPGRYVKQGDLVTVVLGEHRFEHLPVQ